MSVISILKTEITTDPSGAGYSGMSDLVVANELNARDKFRNRTTMQASEVFNAIDKTEFDALTTIQEEQIWNVLHLGFINPFGIEAQIFISIFGGGSTTISTLASLRRETVSRGTILGLPRIREGDVKQARAI